ncbi:MAG: SMC-Scp complex subunit ScpB, partial [Acidobacteriaceae bacterium]|nr:SMC-Scp complex subunit ScpB [Acidobacteriaceae bacterium]
MSLKAKIEAVIYASEEPVTLAQLTGLLSVEAQAELDRNVREQQALAAPESENESNAGAEENDAAVAVAEEPAADAAAEDTDKSRADREAARRLREYFRSILDELVADYATGDRGLEIREVASGYRLATKPEYHDAVRGFIKSLKPPLKLSLQALETLAVIAYKQPVTVPEISEIRGVDSSGVLGSLMTRKLVTTAGRKQVIGRPILYKTTKDFLLRFGLKDISELPSM